MEVEQGGVVEAEAGRGRGSGFDDDPSSWRGELGNNAADVIIWRLCAWTR
jgi:hypothetical protein